MSSAVWPYGTTEHSAIVFVERAASCRTPDRGLFASYPAGVGEDPKARVDQLRRMLEAEIERAVGPQWGCWPLLVGVAGILLGVALLLGWL